MKIVTLALDEIYMVKSELDIPKLDTAVPSDQNVTTDLNTVVPNIVKRNQNWRERIRSQRPFCKTKKLAHLRSI